MLSERSEESRHLLDSPNTELLRSAQDDRAYGFSATCLHRRPSHAVVVATDRNELFNLPVVEI